MMTLYEFLSKASPDVAVSVWVDGKYEILESKVCDIKVPFNLLSREVEEFYTAISSGDEGWTGCKIGIVLKEGHRA